MRSKFLYQISFFFLRRCLRPFLSDSLYLKILYYFEMGKKLPLSNPTTMNEKLQWLKLNNRKSEMTDMVDKLKVKDIVAKKIGKEYIIPTLAVWNSPKEIDLDNLPDSFVIKTNHSGGNTGVIICADKFESNLEMIKAKMGKSLKDDIYKTYAEWPYKNVSRKIFAEKYMGKDVVDYKFYCFNGEVDSVMVCVDRSIGQTKFYFFNKNWELCRYNKAGKAAPVDFTIPKPSNMDKMFELAAKLSEGIPYVRVDLYNIDGKIYFGELTFYPGSGMDRNRLLDTDKYFGSKIDLSLVK